MFFGLLILKHIHVSVRICFIADPGRTTTPPLNKSGEFSQSATGVSVWCFSLPLPTQKINKRKIENGVQRVTARWRKHKWKKLTDTPLRDIRRHRETHTQSHLKQDFLFVNIFPGPTYSSSFWERGGGGETEGETGQRENEIHKRAEQFIYTDW